MPRSAARSYWALLALALAGCDVNGDLIRIGMLNAPFCYLGAALLLGLLRQAWRFREPESPMRPAIMAIPFVMLFVAAQIGLRTGRHSQQDQREILFLAIFSAPLVYPLICGGLCVVMLGIWRLWFSLAPETSYEGAALVSTAVFFSPGLGALFGWIPATEDLVESLSFICLYLSLLLTPVAIGLFVEAFLSKRRLPASG